MNWLIDALTKLGLLTDDLDYHLIRASMVVLFLFFGYQKWFQYEAQVLIPYISNGPLIFWMYPVFGIRGASWFLGCSEWLFGTLLFLVSESESEWLYYIVDTLCKGQANLLIRSCTEAM